MKKILLLTLLVSLHSMAQENIERVQYENDHYRDYTREEMSARFGENAALLPLYACHGINEFNPFWMPRINAAATSLKIQLYNETERLTYQNGKLTNEDGSPAESNSNLFVQKVMPILRKLEKIPEAAKVLRALEMAPFNLTIKHGGNSFTPKEENGRAYQGIYMANALAFLNNGRMTSEDIPFYDIGVGGMINWNAKDETLPGEVTLIHEMYHALDSARGILDMRFVKGEGYESAMVSEHRAVFFENTVRAAVGIDYRTHYGNAHEGPGMLDANGNPRFISSPCLK